MYISANATVYSGATRMCTEEHDMDSNVKEPFGNTFIKDKICVTRYSNWPQMIIVKTNPLKTNI